MSEYLKKRNRSKQYKTNFKSNNGKGYGIDYANQGYERENYNQEGNISENLIKIGKYWESTTILEPKNTSGLLTFIESEENYTLSIVGESLHILNTEDFSILKILKQENEEIISCAYNPNKREIICSMNNSLMRVFSFDSLKCVKSWKLNKIVAKILKIDPSNKFISIVGSNHSILIYDLNTFNLVNSFGGHSIFIYDVSFNPDREKFIFYSASEDGTVKIWDIILNKNIGVLTGHSNGVRHIKLTNDGKCLIAVTTDNNIYLWKLSNSNKENTLLKVINCEKSISSSFYFTRSNENKELTPTLLIALEDGVIQEVNLKSGKISESKKVSFISQEIIQTHYSSGLKRLYLLTTDQVVVCVEIDIVREDVSKSRLINIYPGYCQEVLDVKFLPNTKSNKFLFSSNDNSLKLGELNQLTNKTNIKIIQGHDDFIMSICVKKNFISTSSKDGSIRIWKWEICEESGEFLYDTVCVLKGHSEAVNTTGFILKKGEFKLVSGSKDNSVKLWDFAQALPQQDSESTEVNVINQSLYSQMAHDDEINMVKVSPNEKMIASSSYDKTIKIWSSELKLQSTIKGHKRAVTDLAFSQYAKLLASSSTDKTIKIWNLNDYSLLNTFEGHLSSVLRIQWIYFGTHLVSAGADGLVKFWNVKSSECLNTINAHEGKIWAFDVSQEEEINPKDITNSFKIITGGTDSKILFWNDSSSTKETDTLKKEEDKIVKSERIRLLADQKEYYEAMKLSLELNHKFDFMRSFKNYIDENLKNEDNIQDQISIVINNRKYHEEHDLKSENVDYAVIYKERLQRIIKDQELRKIILGSLDKVLEITRDSNIKANEFIYAQIILKVILVSTNYEEFLNKKEKKLGLKNKGLNNKKKNQLPSGVDYLENFEILKAYSQKHLERINRELTKSYLIDYIIEKMKIQ